MKISMKITVAIDSFKGSLSTFQSGDAVKKGALKVFEDAEVCISPLADGGEGTVEAIVSANNGTYNRVKVHNPLGVLIESSYGYISEKQTAVTEMSSAAGITLINEKERNPLNTTTSGVGEMISDAINKGCRKFIVGIGGSATNDGGIGMLSALGIEFLDENGKAVSQGAKGLKELRKINIDNINPLLKECSFLVACDVNNPLCGENGCSAVYGPQKGADAEMVKSMDTWLSSYAELTKEINENSDKNYPGAGAAGGLGFAFLSYLNAELKSGIDIVIEATSLEEKIKSADIVVTGEGRLDGQSCMGKAPVGVAKLAKKYGKKVVAFSGCVTDDAVLCNEHGIDAFFPILRTPCTLEEAMDCEKAFNNLVLTSEQVFRLMSL